MSISLVLVAFVVFSVGGLPSCLSSDPQYEKCLSPLRCGSTVFSNITYPFWGTDIDKPNYCGQSPFKLSCEGDQNLTLEIESVKLRVISTNLANRIITVADDSWLNGGCPEFWNFTGNDHFTINSTADVFINCPVVDDIDLYPSITCKGSYGDQMRFHVLRSSDSVGNCRKFAKIPMLGSVMDDLQRSNLSFEEALKKGFELRYTMKDNSCQRCIDSDGICGSESDSESFRCLCTDRPHNSYCNDNAVGNANQG